MDELWSNRDLLYGVSLPFFWQSILWLIVCPGNITLLLCCKHPNLELLMMRLCRRRGLLAIFGEACGKICSCCFVDLECNVCILVFVCRTSMFHVYSMDVSS